MERRSTNTIIIIIKTDQPCKQRERVIIKTDQACKQREREREREREKGNLNYKAAIFVRIFKFHCFFWSAQHVFILQGQQDARTDLDPLQCADGLYHYPQVTDSCTHH